MKIKTWTCGPFATNCYLVWDATTRHAAVIDMPPESVDLIDSTVIKEKLSVQAILLTHSHLDHIADVAQGKKRWNAPLYIHPQDRANIEDPGSDLLPLVVPIEPTTVDHLFNEGDLLSIGPLTATVLHTPGHSKGSVCFYFAKEKVLFSGDTLFHGTIGTLSFPTSDPEAMWPSLDRLAALPPDTAVYPGHGPATTIGKEPWLRQAREIFGE